MQPHKYARIIGAGFGLTAMLTASVLFAGPPPQDSFTKDLRFFDRGSSLAADATVFGLDRKRDAKVSLIATAELDLVCINPGGKVVPSQKPDDVSLDLVGDAFYPRHAIDRGRLDIDVETDAIGKQLPGAPDCPNANWTERVERVRFSQARLVVRQGNARALDLFCVFDPPTNDGRVPNSRFHCFSF